MTESEQNTYANRNANYALYNGNMASYAKYTFMAANTKPEDAPPSNQSMSSAAYISSGPK
jgi:hypothetical protein